MISTLYDTALVDLGDGSNMEELGADQLPDLDRSVPTIVTGNIVGGTGHAIVQVTSDMVKVIDFASGFEVSIWPPEGDRKKFRGTITSASVNGTQLLVALQGGRLIYFVVDNDLQLKEAA